MIVHGESKHNSARQTAWEGIEQAFKNTIYIADTFDIATDFECECTACYCNNCPVADKCGESFTAEQWKHIWEEILANADEKLADTD